MAKPEIVHVVRGIVPNYPECGCELVVPTTADGGIGKIELLYCPKHAAAPAMFEALEEVSAFAEMATDDSVNIIEAFEYIDDMVRKCQAALELATEAAP